MEVCKSEYTFFIIFEYYNKILVSEKGFVNYPDALELDRRKHELYNLIDKIIQIMVIRSDFMKKGYLTNTASNTLSQIIRINWNEIFELGDIVNYLKDQFEKIMGAVLKFILQY